MRYNNKQGIKISKDDPLCIESVAFADDFTIVSQIIRFFEMFG